MSKESLPLSPMGFNVLLNTLVWLYVLLNEEACCQKCSKLTTCKGIVLIVF